MLVELVVQVRAAREGGGLGKAGSLKLNYGGVSIKQKRRTLKPKT